MIPMIRILLSALFLFLPMATFAGTFTDKETGVSIELPDGWKLPEKNDYGYLVSSPKSHFGLRLKLINPKRKDMWEAINGMIETFEISASREKAIARYRVIMITPFKTESGISGMRVISGNIDEEKNHIPNVFHYVFENEAGKLVCACLFVSSGIRTSEAADQLIFPNLTLVQP